jgi:molybdopterin synthase sulfur carrier subunit
LKILYFARLRETLETSGEELPLPAGVSDIQGLMQWLAARGGVWAREFATGRTLRAAVNQELVVNSAAVHEDDEVAFFPPVTGG